MCRTNSAVPTGVPYHRHRRKRPCSHFSVVQTTGYAEHCAARASTQPASEKVLIGLMLIGLMLISLMLISLMLELIGLMLSSLMLIGLMLELIGLIGCGL